MSKGYIKLWRKSRDHHFWIEKRSRTKWEAWLDLVMMAAGTDTTRIHRGEEIQLQRGQLIISVRFLGERWKWSKDRTQNYLKYAAETAMISVQEQGHRITIVTITNYDIYNPNGTPIKDTDQDTDKDKYNKEELNVSVQLNSDHS